ncbi:MAG TPA: hypothetical protein VK761_08490 [Solirubrobacteraceae bacterium]|jgi:hypothetical protein|nr:hypothetical protein [Solirubrobacteraceae bacterium]
MPAAFAPVRHRSADPPGDDRKRRGHADAEKLADALLIGERQTQFAEALGLHSQRDPITVDQHAIAVEDHQLAHGLAL